MLRPRPRSRRSASGSGSVSRRSTGSRSATGPRCVVGRRPEPPAAVARRSRVEPALAGVADVQAVAPARLPAGPEPDGVGGAPVAAQVQLQQLARQHPRTDDADAEPPQLALPARLQPRPARAAVGVAELAPPAPAVAPARVAVGGPGRRPARLARAAAPHPPAAAAAGGSASPRRACSAPAPWPRPFARRRPPAPRRSSGSRESSY
jgi:hypothetical protein